MGRFSSALSALALAAGVAAAGPAQADPEDDYRYTPQWVLPGPNPVPITFLFEYFIQDPFFNPTIRADIEVSSNGQTVIASPTSFTSSGLRATASYTATFAYFMPGLYEVNWNYAVELTKDFAEEVYDFSEFVEREYTYRETVYYEYEPQECASLGLEYPCGGFELEEERIDYVVEEIKYYKTVYGTEFYRNYWPENTFSINIPLEMFIVGGGDDGSNGGGGNNVGGGNSIGGGNVVTVPEPASLALLGTGLLAVLGLRRRARVA